MRNRAEGMPKAVQAEECRPILEGYHDPLKYNTADKSPTNGSMKEVGDQGAGQKKGAQEPMKNPQQIFHAFQNSSVKLVKDGEVVGSFDPADKFKNQSRKKFLETSPKQFQSADGPVLRHRHRKS